MNPDLTPLQRAAFVIKQLRKELDEERRTRTEPIAVLGMACRFPGSVTTPEAYWELLAGRSDAIREVPPDRWNIDEYYDPDFAPGTMNTRWGGFIDNVDQFDPTFFDLGQREASAMDPQQRLLLETAWEALEDAAIAPDLTAGSKTGVFVGMCSLDYGSLHAIPPPRGNTGVSLSIAVNRLSYWFDWIGPSLVVDTACSGSLLSVHLAANSLRRGECRMAVAGGVNLILSPTTTVSFSQAGMMAPDGRCKTFDETADGYVRGEGCGLVVLKRLSHAIQDGDRILAVILGSATNQDGRTNGLTAPKGSSQVAVIREALRSANLSPSQISYVEAHGTGTSLGDAVEVGALAEVLGDGRGPDQQCVLSASQCNIGHLESAAGVAGLIKVVLALRQEAIPPVAHFRSLNPKISFGGVPFSIPKSLTPWPASRGNRYAGVSSFSFGGSNVHIVLGEAPELSNGADTAGPPYVLPLAAKSEAALRQLACITGEYLVRHPETLPADAAYTAACGRAHFAHRLAVVANSRAELAESLSRAADGPWPGVFMDVAQVPIPKVAFVFEDTPNLMPEGRLRFYDTEPRFRESLEESVQELNKVISLSVPDLLGAEDEAQHLANFIFQLAQARLMISLGVADWAATGVGMGRWVAAALSGAVSVEVAMRCVVDPLKRGETPPVGDWIDGGAKALCGKGVGDFLRFGAVPVLSEGQSKGTPAEPSTALAQAIAALYVRGQCIDWHAWTRPHHPRKISLPTYPFERRRCWLDPHEIRPHLGVSSG